MEEREFHIDLNDPLHEPDEQDLARLFQLHYAELCAFARVILKDPDIAEDIVQDVFIKLWAKRAEIRFSPAIRAYLFTATKHACLNHIDKRQRRSELLNIYLEGMTAYAENVDAHIHYQDLQQKVAGAIDDLPPRCKEVFVLSRSHFKSHQEIADELGISIKAVEQHIGKALKSLRVSLKDYLLPAIMVALKIFCL